MRPSFSTLGVILCTCTVTNAAHAQTVESTGTPTAGFADLAPVAPPVTITSSAPLAPAPAIPAALSPQTSVASPAPSYGYTPPAPTPAPSQAAYAPARPAAGYGYAAPASTYDANSNYYNAPPRNEGLSYRSGGPAEGGPSADRGGDDSSKKSSKRSDHFRIGVLGGVGFPRPLQIEGMVKIEQMLGLGIEYSALPSLTIESVDTSFYAIAATARFFPLKNGFFIGVRAGRQHLGGEGSLTVAPYGTISESVTIDSTFINPRIGFLWTWDPGITLGIDAGVQVPVGATVSTTVPAGTQANEKVMEVAQSLGNSTLPTFDLIKVGFLL